MVAMPLLGTVATAQDGGIELFAGETIFAQGTRISLTHVTTIREGLLAGSTSIADPLGRRFEERRTVLGVNHGIARGWSVSALVPFVERGLDSSAGDVSGSGPGDMSLILKHRFAQRDWRKGAWHTAWLAGIETPTGETGVRDGGAKLSPGLQPGSGSWDPFVGIASTLDMDLCRFDLVALYKDNGVGTQDYEAGDKLTLALSGKYRFLHTKYPGPTAGATLGLKWAHSESGRLGSTLNGNSGGEELLFKVGVGYHPRPDMDLGLSFDVPLHEHLSGEQLGLDTRVQLSLGWRF